MKTVEITRHKQIVGGAAPESTFKVFMDIYRREGVAGINKGVNAVALRQATNWGSRFGFARLAESGLRNIKGIKEGEKLGALDKILASTVGGALATWNQPIEVVRVEVSAIMLLMNRADLANRCNLLSNRKTLHDQQRRLCSTLCPTSTTPTDSRDCTEVLLLESDWVRVAHRIRSGLSDTSSRRMADHLHGQFRRLRQSFVSGYVHCTLCLG